MRVCVCVYVCECVCVSFSTIWLKEKIVEMMSDVEFQETICDESS